MKYIILLVALVGLSSCQFRRFNNNLNLNNFRRNRPSNNDNEGAYRPDNDGRYRGDNDGRYVGDGSGAYRAGEGRYESDSSGRYIPDKSGLYNDTYKHQEGPSGPNGPGYVGSRDKIDPYKHQKDVFGSGGKGGNDNSGSGGRGSQRTSPTKPSSNVGTKPRQGSDGQHSSLEPAGKFGEPVVLEKGDASGLYDNRNYAIIQKEEKVEEDGYRYLYETENKIFGEEQGRLGNKGTDNEAMQSGGYYKYTGPDNIVYRVDYTADENGFIPHGAHIPTPPPIPPAILRALEYQKSIGELD